MPRAYLLSYDLRGGDEDAGEYAELFAAAEKLGTDRRRILYSLWIIVTGRLTASMIAERLQPYLNDDDRLVVTRYQADDAVGGGLEPADERWLEAHAL